MPSDRLARGKRATVEVTDEIRKLVQIGAVAVVAGNLDDPDAAAYDGSKAEPADHTGVTENDPSGVSPLPTGDFAPADEPQTVEAQDGEPVGDEPKARRSRARSSGDS